MTSQELQNQITNLGNQIRSKSATLAARASDPAVPMDDVVAMQGEVADMNKRMEALQQALAIQQQAEASSVQPLAAPTQPAAHAEPRNPSGILGSNEYARAFAFAIRNGLNPRNARSHEQCRILYDAMTESGGNPAGSDGGFLVPDDIDHSIREIRRTLDPLASLFNEETVTAPQGWRVMDNAPTTGLVPVDEMGQIDDDDDQPMFSKVTYAVSKYALILPVSNELLTDNVANLFAYLSRWFAKKEVIRENALLIAALRTLTATSISSDPIKGLKTALNKGLDPAISALATVICNQSGFDALDQIQDGNDRPLLQPDPTNATVKRFAGRPVHAVSNATMGDITTGSGSSAVTTTDLFIGDGKEFATLYRCGAYEISSTDVGGNAWRTDSTEIRGIVRLGVSKFDTAAMVRRSLTL